MKSLLLIPVTVLGLAFAAPAHAVDVNCEFPTGDTERPCVDTGRTAHYFGGDEDNDAAYVAPSPTTPSGYKYTPAKACDWNSTSISFFGACTGDGDKTPTKLRVSPQVHSTSYPLGAVNNKAEPTIDDWNGAFASGN